MKAVIDTNILIYDLVEDSEFHKEAGELLDSLEEWLIPSLVIHEFTWFLRANNIDNVEYIKSYVANERTKILCDNDNIIGIALEILTKERLSLSRYNDVVILAHTIENKLPLATKDKALKSLAKRHGVEVV
ncbi:putative nucleic acid-binding protein, contains PIN domain [Metallosphaera yellowstonensis MK1]|uniref:Ribonuclease VapC n=1 Tax=Metallosphaera yellowstonensis MK1 TaxID=671065 RepID=H2C2F9_9CREN|nr:PIN domain-containing protein [Metallosphaera yellowstonensis]EHP70430.1 putative nucleic acid-binding protein, contains PIN domain [Metallosphaera yellowstonensis MK1]